MPSQVLQCPSNPNAGAHVLRSIMERRTPLTHAALGAAGPDMA